MTDAYVHEEIQREYIMSEVCFGLIKNNKCNFIQPMCKVTFCYGTRLITCNSIM